VFWVGETVAAEVRNIRVGVYPSKTRIVMDLTDRVSFNVFTLAQPYRVVIELPKVFWSKKIRNPPRGGLINIMRFGLFKPGLSRLVVDTKFPVKVSKAFLMAPSRQRTGYRLVIDMTSISHPKFMEEYYRTRPNLKNRKNKRTLTKKFSTQRKARAIKKPLIMIDPGHGGVDSGAISRSGVWEKHIVLAFAKEFRRQLLATGKFLVLLSRNKDIFIRLRDRIKIARRAGADLFISIHADSIKNRKIRGTAVYTLSEKASDKEAAALARRANKAELIAGLDLNEKPDDVVNILIDLAQRETMTESAVFAKRLVKDLGLVSKLLRNTHRSADFAVLKAPDIPSVLVELGYLSNRSDEKMLINVRQRRLLAKAMLKSVKAYFYRRGKLSRP
tara:strand:- start:672 stop:1835 length:1164 start_codon:yes stop_codon:yes gene_type:complete